MINDKLKLNAIANFLDDFIKDTDDLQKIRPNDTLSENEINELKAQRELALGMFNRFHLEENLD